MQDESLKFGFATLKRWLENRNAGKTFVEYILAHDWKTVGIYGAGEIGQLLYNEIRGKTDVVYFIDRNAETYDKIDDIVVVLPQDLVKYPQCDIIINTVMSDFDSIVNVIAEQRQFQTIIALRDAVYEF
jgi:phosphoglycerate dehydrogenase-like enzyme